MNKERFITAYRESRNGTDNFYFNKLVPNFYYSDGVMECAKAGCYWLVMLFATTIVAELQKKGIRPGSLAIAKVDVSDNKATITVELDDNETDPIKHHIEITDMPEGEWKFYISYGGTEYGFRCILPSEY